MANPSPDAIKRIKGYLDLSASSADCLTKLNAPSVDNPAKRETVPKPWNAIDLVTAIGATRRANVGPFLAAIRPDLDAQNATALTGWAFTLEAIGAIQQSDVDAISAVVQATEDDPAYQSQIPWSVASLGRLADLHDVLAAKDNS